MISRKTARMVASSSGPFFRWPAGRSGRLPLRGPARRLFALVVLGLADFAGDGGPFVDQLEDLQVELVDLGPQALQLRRAERVALVLFGVVLSPSGLRACQCLISEGYSTIRLVSL